MKTEDGGKPQLTLVDNSGAVERDYPNFIVEMIQTLSTRRAKGESIQPMEVLRHLDTSEDNSAIKEWMANNDVVTKARFDKLLEKVAREERLQRELGFVPTDAVDFVQRYTAQQNVTLTPLGQIKRSVTYAVGDTTIDATNCDEVDGARLIYDIAASEGNDTATLSREMRLVVARLNLGYRDTVLADAFSAWQAQLLREAKIAVFTSIAFEKGTATGKRGREMWETVERACFDVSATQPGFAVAVLKKFIWQVKRKARNLPVTNHLMPVITGPQGLGKSEFVKAMCAPLEDLMRSVDFNLLCDGKTMDVWSSPVLFLDEMGFVGRQSMDQIKNLITTPQVTIRAMRQNEAVMLPNKATLIGCTNRSLGELIRDDTGVRRFAELEWSRTPNWEASNAVDWMLLWQSVDELGEDPMMGAGMMGALRTQQEENRNQSSVEQWARLHGKDIQTWKSGNDMHADFREWEKDAFPIANTNVLMFGRQLTHLISTVPDFPMQKQRTKSGVQYRGA
ncbi:MULTISPECIES: virulence-associated E family protein [unclassified Sphingobium]|uniref:virulence-associated E family protein n=1 Tax=unclassified Sphingobium TaxID=2611147 RepID=UPI002225A4E8|nr:MULTISPECIES: virulence-associated E family protein [unclassified Sphingobium]MCW2412952.1 hypothetical protein [Sphingobium sp. B8D3D]MCW2414750.1 hypothetical protein [Sphingobium sp. B8D3A]